MSQEKPAEAGFSRGAISEKLVGDARAISSANVAPQGRGAAICACRSTVRDD
jgi:hypothetical protein